MLYEKKMLILSGDGKGVVLIEKSAAGVRFSLSTFDMPICGELKAGVITPTEVFVRDLPSRPDPSCVFVLGLRDISKLHFAVFDEKLRLYGTNAKRMWEANVMDLLRRSDRRPPIEEGVSMPALPPIVEPPKVLPMPDGSGIPQTRLEIYGDDALAESNFYTPIDMSARMPTVDNFLDGPRLLDGLAPRVLPRTMPSAAETTATADAAEEASSSGKADPKISDDTAEYEIDSQVQVEPQPRVEPQAQPAVNDVTTESAPNAESPEVEAAAEPRSRTTPYVQAELQPTVESKPQAAEILSDAAAVAESTELPWQMAARYLKSRGKRNVRVERATVKPMTGAGERVRFVRDTAFSERTKTDVEKLFKNAPKDDKLTELLPDLEWVRVDTDGHTISVGRGGNEFLCYAVAGGYEKTSPLGEQSQWLPADRNVPTGKGYWLIFQSLSSGEIIGGM